jgi:hypothetical protein
VIYVACGADVARNPDQLDRHRMKISESDPSIACLVTEGLYGLEIGPRELGWYTPIKWEDVPCTTSH